MIVRGFWDKKIQMPYPSTVWKYRTSSINSAISPSFHLTREAYRVSQQTRSHMYCTTPGSCGEAQQEEGRPPLNPHTWLTIPPKCRPQRQTHAVRPRHATFPPTLNHSTATRHYCQQVVHQLDCESWNNSTHTHTFVFFFFTLYTYPTSKYMKGKGNKSRCM